jgi:hypothetical protein
VRRGVFPEYRNISSQASDVSINLNIKACEINNYAGARNIIPHPLTKVRGLFQNKVLRRIAYLNPNEGRNGRMKNTP